jgi:hypothetical protein
MLSDKAGQIPLAVYTRRAIIGYSTVSRFKKGIAGGIGKAITYVIVSLAYVWKKIMYETAAITYVIFFHMYATGSITYVIGSVTYVIFFHT